MARNATLDYARLAAALGIVLFHAQAPGAAIGYAGLPFFLIAAMALALPGAAARPFAGHAAARARRLLVPWLVWSALYLALDLFLALHGRRPEGPVLAPWMLTAGPSLHLWFLPYAFVTGLAAPPLARLAAGPATPGRLALTGLLSAAALLALGLDQPGGLPVPFAQWAYGAPATLLGAALGVAALGAGAAEGLLAGAAAAGAVLAGAAALGWTAGLLQLAIALAAFLACRALVLPRTAASAAAARLSLTVYLAHPAVETLVQHITGWPDGDLRLALAMAAGALLLAAALDRAAVLRYRR
jgi:fucose 4-O-acetylase-like acetyltransferase